VRKLGVLVRSADCLFDLALAASAEAKAGTETPKVSRHSGLV
jgi:hypothetical protein